MRRIVKLSAGCVAVFAIVCVVALTILKFYLDATYFNGYNPDATLDARVAESFDGAAGRYTKFYYKGYRGDEAPALLALPKEGQGPFPCIVFLHGFGDDKDYMFRSKLDEPFLRAGFAFATFDQLMSGERELPKDVSPLTLINALRLRAAYTVNDARRMIDYLETREDIAHDRIYLVGFSFGAITGTTATAFDARVRAAVLLCGGGRLVHLLDSKTVAKELGRWKLPAQGIALYLWTAFDPVKFAGGIAPRPVFVVNGTDDTAMNPDCAKALHDALGEPKIIQWYKGEHFGIPCEGVDMKQVEAQALKDTVKFLTEQDAKGQRKLP